MRKDACGIIYADNASFHCINNPRAATITNAYCLTIQTSKVKQRTSLFPLFDKRIIAEIQIITTIIDMINDIVRRGWTITNSTIWPNNYLVSITTAPH